jgi:3-dehydroquinate dehydratase-1
VAPILSLPDLWRAARMRRPPDLFELRLDAFARDIDGVEQLLPQLRRPLIVTCRHPAEGGEHNLTVVERRALLLRFLPDAAFVDVELRSAGELKGLLAAAEAKQIGRILSWHALDRTPALAEMHRAAERARVLRADIFKIAVQTDTPNQLERLLTFFDEVTTTVRTSAMGIGKLGRVSRIELARRGSALHYAHLGRATVAGQLSLAAARRLLQA